MVVHALGEDLLKETFTVSDMVKDQIKSTVPYSAAFFHEQRSFVIGSDQYLLLLRYNDQLQIESAQRVPEPNAFAVTLLPYAGTLYYRTLDGMKQLDITTGEVTTVFSTEAGRETTLMLL